MVTDIIVSTSIISGKLDLTRSGEGIDSYGPTKQKMIGEMDLLNRKWLAERTYSIENDWQNGPTILWAIP